MARLRPLIDPAVESRRHGVLARVAALFGGGRVPGGEAALLIDGTDVALGETLTGRLKTERRLPATGHFDVALRCVEAVVVSARPAAAYRDRTRYEAHVDVAAAGVDSTVGVPFSIALPATSPVQGAAQARVRWTISVRVPVGARDYVVVFAIPVLPGTRPRMRRS